MLKELKTKTATIPMPVFFPDATKAVIKSIGSHNLKQTKTDGLVVNTYHLINDEMIDTIKTFGGIHKFMNLNVPMISDSGGFQVMSLVRRNPNNGHIGEDGITFKLEGKHKKLFLTPESCIKTQLDLGTDIIMCLDDCTDPDEPQNEQEKSVERTIRWAKLCRQAFDIETQNFDSKPLLFAIIQGGNNKDLREKCADALIEIGFDGFAYGGFPVNEKREFLSEILEFTVSQMPEDKPRYAMGVGMPKDIQACVQMGYNMFDCVLPTRDARHKRLYVFTNPEKNEYEFLYMSSSKHKLSAKPVSELCDCETCKNYSRGYLYHLFKIGDALSLHLATIHNLRFYSMFMENIRKNY